MYRSRSRIKLDKYAFKFLSSMDDDHAILYYDILGSEAHSIMLYEIGFLTLLELKKILQGLEEVKKNPKLISNNGYEDIHESLEAFIIKRAGSNAGGKMHTARSRNDQIILDIRMKIREYINDICAAIIDLIDSLLAIAHNNKETIMPMYTHLQQAQIGTFSHFLLSYADALFRDMDRLYNTYGRINQSPLGAGAIGGSSINIDRKKTAILLGFDGLIKNSIDATTSRDSLIEFTTGLSILMITLSRMAEDFMIWSTIEFDYIEISEKYSSTSSAMPQKKNPDALELVRAKAALVLGNLVTMFSIVKSLPSGYSRDLQDLKPSLWKTSSTALESVKIMNGVVKSLNIHKERMEEAASNSYAISLDIAEQLVVKKGMPFRSAHKVVGALVEEAVSKNRSAFTSLQKEDIRTVLRRIESDLHPEELIQIMRQLTPIRSLQLRVSAGSPNPKEQREMISFSFRRLARYREEMSKRKKSVTVAFDKLAKSVESYLNA
ncbi:MAG: argininosuccinate lyase [Nitrososphaeraceae archaeon]